MLKLEIQGGTFFDEITSTFVESKPITLKLEHSLLSISKWESKWEVPFLHEDPANPKSSEMILDYIKCMTINDVSPVVYSMLGQDEINKISEYINGRHSATTFTDNDAHPKKRNNQIITSELIYYWMFAAQIPLECERWHIARLLNVIRIHSIYNDPDKNKAPKIGKRQQAMSRSELNRKRREIYNTKG